MARLPRFVLPGELQHVIQRGNNEDIIFISEEDYRFYLEKIEEACRRFNCLVHAYVLMTNHVHLLMTSEEKQSISQIMQSLGRVYVRKRTGTLWEGRYKATLLDSEAYLLTCYRYIELNPTRAAMVKHPGEYPWFSYSSNAIGIEDPLISPHELYLRLGSEPGSRRQHYCTLFQAHIPETTIEEIREATNKAWVLGNDRFRSRIEDLLDRQSAPKQTGGDRKSEKYQAEKWINRV